MSQRPHKVIHLPKVRMLRGGRPSSTIKITNVKSIKPPDPEMVKKQEEEKLRAQLQKEIVCRSRTCAHRGYSCAQPVAGGRAHCALHVLADPGAPYRRCAHVHPSGLRCTAPAPAAAPATAAAPPSAPSAPSADHRDQGLCFEHARQTMHARQRSAAPPPPVVTPESLLNQLHHYIQPERTRTASCASSVSVVSEPAEPEPPAHAATHPLDPFKQINATAVNASVSSSIMECASSSESDGECEVTLGAGGDARARCDHSEEHPDPPAEAGPLWHAGVYTAEEAVSEAKSVLRSLQAAYLRQMGRLRVLLQVARSQYLKSLRTEKEQHCSINTQAKSGPLTVRERRQLRKLKAYASYHRKHGVDAVLARKLHRKRARANDLGPPRGNPSQGRCTFAEGGVRCENSALPAARHCMKHILHDKHQVLFIACGDPRGGVACREPACRLPLPSQLCRYHSAAQPQPHAYKDMSDAESSSGSESHLGQSPAAEMSSIADQSSLADQSSAAEQSPGTLQSLVDHSPLHDSMTPVTESLPSDCLPID